MDVVLQTNLDDHSLALRDVRRFAGNASYVSRCVIQSGNLRGEATFYFESFPLGQFVAAVETMDQTLSGEAVLKPMWEPDFIKLVVDKSGGIRVSGEFQENSGEQLLRFSFVTDQTCLRPLATALRQCQQLQPETAVRVAT